METATRLCGLHTGAELDVECASDQIDAKRVLREIIIMKNLVHENILGLLDVVYVPRES